MKTIEDEIVEMIKVHRDGFLFTSGVTVGAIVCLITYALKVMI